jgi:hypothetical protein
LLFQLQAFAQATEVPRIEIAPEFSTLALGDLGGRTAAGFGARFTYNLNNSIALETSASFFPDRCHHCFGPGRIGVLLGGLKAGKRFRTWGLFGKVRPGIVTYGRAQTDFILTGNSSLPFEIQQKGVDTFSTDIGAVLEFYPSRRIVTRFDGGDLISHFGRRTTNTLSFDPVTNTYSLIPFTLPSRTTHRFQFSASVGFRF